jgi:methyltransferase (TIGR00027 family)
MTDVSDVRLVRTDGDSWDITESVGATALGVAAARAAETSRPDALIRDDFAYLLTASAGPAWAQMASTDTAWLGDDEYGRRMHEMARNYQAVRTHYFDSYFHTASRDGIRQVVILAAGLDSRAYRIDWPSGTTVFEIDQPKVLEYKSATLDAHGAVPKSRRVAVPVDLRDDWPAALIDAGFDPAQPTAWLAEGLLPYLPGEAQDRLFAMVTQLSGADSQIAVEAFNLKPSQFTAEKRSERRERTAHLRDRLGLDVDVDTLMYTDDKRADAAEWLSEHDWRVDAVPSAIEMARLGRPAGDELAGEGMDSVLLRARLEGPRR